MNNYNFNFKIKIVVADYGLNLKIKTMVTNYGFNVINITKGFFLPVIDQLQQSNLLSYTFVVNIKIVIKNLNLKLSF